MGGKFHAEKHCSPTKGWKVTNKSVWIALQHISQATKPLHVLYYQPFLGGWIFSILRFKCEITYILCVNWMAWLKFMLLEIPSSSCTQLAPVVYLKQSTRLPLIWKNWETFTPSSCHISAKHFGKRQTKKCHCFSRRVTSPSAQLGTA